MGGVVCVRGVCAGAASRPFFAADLLAHLPSDCDETTVYADTDPEGAVCAAGGKGGKGGERGEGSAARLATHARLAPHDLCADAQLELADGTGSGTGSGIGTGTGTGIATGTGVGLRLRVVRPVPPLGELRVWFSCSARAALQLPHLAPHHIRGKREYSCECGATFEQPNPLKVHLFLRCEAYGPARFWRALAWAMAPPAAPDPLALEALAALWGRRAGRGGHSCVFCGKVYSRRYGLKIHVRTHTGHRPLRCRVCARAFGDPSNLNKHVRLHEGKGKGKGEGEGEGKGKDKRQRLPL